MIIDQLQFFLKDIQSIMQKEITSIDELNYRSRNLENIIKLLRNDNLSYIQEIKKDNQSLIMSLLQNLDRRDEKLTQLEMPRTYDVSLEDTFNEIRNSLQVLESKLSYNQIIINQEISQLTTDSVTHVNSLEIEVSDLRNELRNSIDKLSSKSSTYDQNTPQLSEPSSQHQIFPLDKLLIYQQVSNEYTHIITTPLASIDTAIANIKERLPSLLQGSPVISADSASILLSSLENALISLDSIKSILRQGAGFSSNAPTVFSIEAIVRKASRMATNATPGRLEPLVVMNNLPDVKYYAAILLIAIVQVLDNAYEALNPGGNIVIEGKCVTSDRKVEIFITNDGEPIDPEVRDKIFDLGFSTKGPEHGLGLAIARKHLEAVNGKIDLVSSDDNGTTFKISFQPEEIYQTAGG